MLDSSLNNSTFTNSSYSKAKSIKCKILLKILLIV